MAGYAATLEALDAVIHQLYEAALAPEVWPAVLADLGDLLGGCALGMSFQACPTVQTDYETTPRIDAARLDPGYVALMVQNYTDCRTNPMVAAMSRLPAAVAMPRQAVKCDSDYFGSGLYNDIFRPQGLVHTAVACAFKSPENFVPLGIFRRASQQEFGDREYDLLKLVLPHLQRALQIHFRLGALDAQQQASESALDSLSFGVIFFESNGRVWTLNRVAEAILAEGDGLAIRNGRLTAASANEERKLQFLIGSALAAIRGGGVASAGGPIAISRPSTAQPLSIFVAPLPVSGGNGLARSGAVAFIADPARCTSSSADTLTVLFGLTQTEARVTSLLVAGLTVDEVARRMRITPNTVRSHLKCIFGKTDANRQADLVRVVLNSVATVTGPDDRERPAIPRIHEREERR